MGTNLKNPWRRGLDCSEFGEAAAEPGTETAALTQLRLRETAWLMAAVGLTKRSEMEHVSHARKNYSVLAVASDFFLRRRMEGKGRKEMRGQDICSESPISR